MEDPQGDWRRHQGGGIYQSDCYRQAGLHLRQGQLGTADRAAHDTRAPATLCFRFESLALTEG